MVRGMIKGDSLAVLSLARKRCWAQALAAKRLMVDWRLIESVGAIRPKVLNQGSRKEVQEQLVLPGVPRYVRDGLMDSDRFGLLNTSFGRLPSRC